jgi:hypothetical protein
VANASQLQVVVAASRICSWVASQKDFAPPKVDSAQLFADAAIAYFQDKVAANQAAAFLAVQSEKARILNLLQNGNFGLSTEQLDAIQKAVKSNDSQLDPKHLLLHKDKFNHES